LDFDFDLQFCFLFNLEGKTHRTMDKAMAVPLWKVVLKGRRSIVPDARLESFCGFVETQTTYSNITADQWTSFLEFCHEFEGKTTCTSNEDLLRAYNDDESQCAWPVLIDEYVEHLEQDEQKQNKIPSE
jgi:hypothetical protein